MKYIVVNTHQNDIVGATDSYKKIESLAKGCISELDAYCEVNDLEIYKKYAVVKNTIKIVKV